MQYAYPSQIPDSYIRLSELQDFFLQDSLVYSHMRGGRAQNKRVGQNHFSKQSLIISYQLFLILNHQWD